MRIALLLCCLAFAPQASGQGEKVKRPITIGSKPFAESVVLAEMFAELLTRNGYEVIRRPNLATDAAFRALVAGEIDVYPEYTGTGLIVLLKSEPLKKPREVFRVVRREFAARYGIHWLPPLGFENTYAICVRKETAEKYNLVTLTDLARAASKLKAGLTPDFISRPDGLPGLKTNYGLEPAEVNSLVSGIKYTALDEGEVDFIDGYSTDGQISRYDFVVLQDDRNFFPPYEAAPLVGQNLWEEDPDAVLILSGLAGCLDEITMRRLNEKVMEDKLEPTHVARAELSRLGLVEGSSETITQSGTGFWSLLLRAERLRQCGEHIKLVLLSLLAGIIVAVPLAVVLVRLRRGAEIVLRIVGLFQTIPSIALLTFMIPLLGIGTAPALMALFLYSLLPILRNTYAGIRDIRPDTVESAQALGMTPGQILYRVQLPLATPLIMAGIRTAAVINVGTATLAAFIAAGGLGQPIVEGLYLFNAPLILSGAIPAAVLALVFDGILALLEKGIAPKGLEPRKA